MVAVLYGTRRVPVFYWVFVHFNTARISALWLLPVWLLVEALQWAAGGGGRVAYGAHIAGFLSGAVLAWLLKPADSGKVDRILDEQVARCPGGAQVDTADGSAPGRREAGHAARGARVFRTTAGGSDQYAARDRVLQHGAARP